MPKTRSAEPTDVSRAWADLQECVRALRARESKGNAEAVGAAALAYHREAIADLTGEAPVETPAPGPKLKSVS